MNIDNGFPLEPNVDPDSDGQKSQPLSDDNPDALDDLLPAYSIGATDPEEEETIRAQLVGLPDAAAELAEYAALNRALLHSAGYRAPSPALAENIRAAVRLESPTIENPADAQRISPDWRHRLQKFMPWPRVAASALVLLLLISNVASILRIITLQDQQRLLSEQLLRHNEVLAVLINNGMQETILPAAQEESNARATVRWLVDRPVAVLFADEFPLLDKEQVYQLWLVRDGERSSGGLFTVDNDGSGALVIETDAPLGVYERMGITPEPAGGSPGPTGSAVVRGTLQ